MTRILRASLIALLPLLVLPPGPGWAAPPELTLWARDAKTLWKLAYSKKGWLRRGEVDLRPFAAKRGLPGQRLLPGAGGGIVVCTSRAILEVDPGAKKARARFTARPKASIGDCARHGGHLIVATDNGLVVLDRRYKEQGRLRLLEAKHREVHGILIHEDVAYLLDNIFTPVYVFRVDLRRLASPRIIQRITLSGPNTHVSWQWLDLKRRRWAVVRDQSTLHGMWQAVHLYPAGREAKGEVETQQLFGYSRVKRKLTKGLDTRILAVLPDGSRALTTTYGEGRLRLGRVTLPGDRVKIRHLLPLKKGVKWYAQACLARGEGASGKYLAVYAEKTLWLIKDGRRPRVMGRHPAPGALRALLLVPR